MIIISCLLFLLQTLRVPYSEKADSSGATVQEFHEDDIQDDTYKAILQQSYSMFKARYQLI